jgi:arylsulfatase A-like enzyme
VVNALDLYGTVLDYAGDTAWRKPEIEARSLASLLKEDPDDWLNETWSIIGADAERSLTMLRRDDLKLIRLGRGQDAPLYELYDMNDDPLEVRDLYDDAAYRARRDGLVADLDAWARRQGDLYPKDPVSYHR